MQIPDEDNTMSSFTQLELSVYDEDVVFVFLLNGTRFYVSITSKMLEGSGELLQEFHGFRDGLDDPETMFNFEEWVLGALGDDIRQVAPSPAPGARQPITLLEYFSPPTFAFELVNREGKLCTLRENYNPQIHGDTAPRTRIVQGSPPPMSQRRGSDSSASSRGSLPGRGVILRSALPDVPLVPASQLERVDDGLHDEQMSDIPSKVRRVGTAKTFFFKAALKANGHRREMDILSRIKRSSPFDSTFRTSSLASLVVWEDNSGEDKATLMGFLLEYIEGGTLAERMEAAPVEMRRKWFHQVQSTVGRLHELGIVWGDVKPDNIIINVEGDAVVVDFGGGFNPEYIEPELQQTLQGDLIALDHMAHVLGLNGSS